MSDLTNYVRGAAEDHATRYRHHVAHVPGVGWLCEECDDDFTSWVLDHFGKTVEHFGAKS